MPFPVYNKPSDWDEWSKWYALQAIRAKVWEYIDPTTTNTWPSPPSRPPSRPVDIGDDGPRYPSQPLNLDEESQQLLQDRCETLQKIRHLMQQNFTKSVSSEVYKQSKLTSALDLRLQFMAVHRHANWPLLRLGFNRICRIHLSTLAGRDTNTAITQWVDKWETSMDKMAHWGQRYFDESIHDDLDWYNSLLTTALKNPLLRSWASVKYQTFNDVVIGNKTIRHSDIAEEMRKAAQTVESAMSKPQKREAQDEEAPSPAKRQRTDSGGKDIYLRGEVVAYMHPDGDSVKHIPSIHGPICAGWHPTEDSGKHDPLVRAPVTSSQSKEARQC